MGEERPRVRWSRWLELVLVIAATSVTAYYAHSANSISQESLALSEQLAAAEVARSEAESERAAVKDFVARYFTSSCEQKVQLIQFPMRRFFNEIDNAKLDENYVRAQCGAPHVGAPPTYVVRDVHLASPAGDGEYLVTATLLFDSGGEDYMHRIDGVTAVEMRLASARGAAVRAAGDLRMLSIAEVQCTAEVPCP